MLTYARRAHRGCRTSTRMSESQGTLRVLAASLHCKRTKSGGTVAVSGDWGALGDTVRRDDGSLRDALRPVFQTASMSDYTIKVNTSPRTDGAKLMSLRACVLESLGLPAATGAIARSLGSVEFDEEEIDEHGVHALWLSPDRPAGNDDTMMPVEVSKAGLTWSLITKKTGMTEANLRTMLLDKRIDKIGLCTYVELMDLCVPSTYVTMSRDAAHWLTDSDDAGNAATWPWKLLRAVLFVDASGVPDEGITLTADEAKQIAADMAVNLTSEPDWSSEICFFGAAEAIREGSLRFSSPSADSVPWVEATYLNGDKLKAKLSSFLMPVKLQDDRRYNGLAQPAAWAGFWSVLAYLGATTEQFECMPESNEPPTQNRRGLAYDMRDPTLRLTRRNEFQINSVEYDIRAAEYRFTVNHTVERNGALHVKKNATWTLVPRATKRANDVTLKTIRDALTKSLLYMMMKAYVTPGEQQFNRVGAASPGTEQLDALATTPSYPVYSQPRSGTHCHSGAVYQFMTILDHLGTPHVHVDKIKETLLSPKYALADNIIGKPKTVSEANRLKPRTNTTHTTWGPITTCFTPIRELKQPPAHSQQAIPAMVKPAKGCTHWLYKHNCNQLKTADDRLAYLLAPPGSAQGPAAGALRFAVVRFENTDGTSTHMYLLDLLERVLLDASPAHKKEHAALRWCPETLEALGLKRLIGFRFLVLRCYSDSWPRLDVVTHRDFRLATRRKRKRKPRKRKRDAGSDEPVATEPNRKRKPDAGYVLGADGWVTHGPDAVSM